MRFTPALCLLGLMLVLGACSSKKEEAAPIATVEEADEAAAKLYNEGMDLLDQSKYKKSIEVFEEVDRLYPYAIWATKAQLMAAYARYKNGDYDDAVTSLDQFINLHPASESIDYAYYLKALCYYERIRDVGRDQDVTERARDALKEVVTRFPDSKYGRDAKYKMDLTEDHLAGKEMEVGRFYLKQNKRLAAINRFRKVVDNFQTTAHTPEALYRLVETYLALGIKPEAIKYGAVLGHNFPESKWYRYGYDMLMKAGAQDLAEPK